MKKKLKKPSRGSSSNSGPPSHPSAHLPSTTSAGSLSPALVSSTHGVEVSTSPTHPALGISASLPPIGASTIQSGPLPSADTLLPPSPTLSAARPLMAPPTDPVSMPVNGPVNGPNIGPPPSWRNLVRGSGQLQKRGNTFLMDSGDICVDIPNTVIHRNENRWKDFILGQFHGNAPPPGTFHAIVNGIWSPRLKNISVSKLSEKAYLIKIPCPLTRSRILSQGVWHIERQTMFVGNWHPGLTPATPELTSVPVWLDFHNVPLQFYSQEGLEHIAGTLGEPLLLHPRTKNMVNLAIARVLTVVDPTKPLPEAVYVRFESGHTQRIEVSCQWLPPTCSHCQQIGHTIKRCPTAPVTCPRCKSSAHSQVNCPRTTAGNKFSNASVFTDELLQQHRQSAPIPVPEPEKPIVASTPIVIGTLDLDIGATNNGASTDSMVLSGHQSTVIPTTSSGQLSTMIVQQEQGSTSKSLRSRRKLPLYFTASGPAILSSETDVGSSDTENSYKYSDDEEFPHLSARLKKVEAYKDKKPYKH